MGPEISDVLSYCAQAKDKKESLLCIEEKGNVLLRQRDELLATVRLLAKQISSLRKENAKVLAARVQEHIRDLAMEQAEFVIEVKEKDGYGETGQDEVEFLFSANPGQPLRSLGKVASGGELSRIALSVKTVLLGRAGLPTMVFDEIDSGVGGATAQRMAEKLSLLASKKQVLSITHLPQIACMADCHIYIDKKQAKDSTFIEIGLLNDEQKVDELTRMISGDNKTDLARDNAGQMIRLARDKKQLLRQDKL